MFYQLVISSPNRTDDYPLSLVQCVNICKCVCKCVNVWVGISVGVCECVGVFVNVWVRL